MEATTAIKERRSVRKYQDKKVDHETMREIMELTKWAPSWANYQIARYTLIDDEAIINQIAESGVQGFAYNIGTLKNAKGVAVLSFVQGKSGKLGDKADTSDDKASAWEAFDAGISCQTFCLAAQAKGVATCIFGVIDHEEIGKIAKLPAEETVAALIVYGYEAGAHVAPTERKPVDEIVRFMSK